MAADRAIESDGSLENPVIKTVVADDLHFKRKLHIGEKAYAVLRARDRLADIWETAGAAATGAGIASSATVAGTFFAPTGITAWLGLATATTPIGWVAVAGVVAGCGYLGASRWLRKQTGSYSDTIPRYITTPIDVLGIGLIEFYGRIALRLAAADGDLDSRERDFIVDHFVDDWGYDRQFVIHALGQMESDLQKAGTKDLTRGLARLLAANPDCNACEMQNELVTFLGELSEVDGVVVESEEFAIEAIVKVFEEESALTLASVRNTAKRRGHSILKKGRRILRFLRRPQHVTGVMYD